MGELFLGYRDLIGTPRGQRTYGYVFVNSIFHSGVFTWLGVYFEQRYGLGPVGIGVALLGYGIPGFLFGPLIGRSADRWGRARGSYERRVGNECASTFISGWSPHH